jgi:hypothetical protein
VGIKTNGEKNDLLWQTSPPIQMGLLPRLTIGQEKSACNTRIKVQQKKPLHQL